MRMTLLLLSPLMITDLFSLLGWLVWYQKFEYAIAHWLHKTAEHVMGVVLCTPGCFSMFRASALMDNNIIKTFTREVSLWEN